MIEAEAVTAMWTPPWVLIAALAYVLLGVLSARWRFLYLRWRRDSNASSIDRAWVPQDLRWRDHTEVEVLMLVLLWPVVLFGTLVWLLAKGLTVLTLVGLKPPSGEDSP